MRRRERVRLSSIFDLFWKLIDCEDGCVLWFYILKGELSDYYFDVYEDL